MNILDTYIEGIKNSYVKVNKPNIWNNFVSNRSKITEENIELLNNKNVPKLLIDLYKFTNGTDDISFVILGSDIEGLGYFLENINELLTPNRFSNDFFIHIHNKNKDFIDKKIIPLNANNYWLHFANSEDNGRTSELYVDLSPSRYGVIGQIIRFNLETGEFKVISSSFEEYLKLLIEKNYNYIK